MISASFNGYLEIVNLLLQNADRSNDLDEMVSSRDASGMTALMFGK